MTGMAPLCWSEDTKNLSFKEDARRKYVKGVTNANSVPVRK
jgi:hypothetical protein